MDRLPALQGCSDRRRCQKTSRDPVDWATQSPVMVLPFMMGNGPHVTRDIAGVLGLHRDSVLDGVTGGRDRHRVILCEVAIGTDSRFVNFVADLARGSEDHGGEWTR